MTPPKGGGRKSTGDARGPIEQPPPTAQEDPASTAQTTQPDPGSTTHQNATQVSRPTLCVWLRQSQAELVAEIARLSGLTIALAGSPDSGRSSSVADLLAGHLASDHAGQRGSERTTHAQSLAPSQITPIDDIRTLISRAEPGSVVLLASIARFGTDGDRADLRLIAAAADRGVRVFSFEPIPASVAHLISADPSRRGAGPRHQRAEHSATDSIGAKRTPDWWAAVGHDATDLLSHVGRPCALAVESIASPDHGSLSARLLDVCSLIVGLLGQPELVDATLAPANFAGGSLHLTADTLGPDLAGTITLNARYADGRAASAIASNAADLWRRNATLLTSAGAILIDEHHAQAASEQPPRPQQPQNTPTSACASLIAAQINQYIQQREATTPQHGTVSATASTPESARDAAEHTALDRASLALAEAALLSTRTGEPESPATIERLAAAVIGL